MSELERAIRLAQEANDDCRRWSVLVTELQAVIVEALRQTRRGNLMTPPWVIEALCQSPADALAAHDAVIRKDQAKKDAAIATATRKVPIGASTVADTTWQTVALFPHEGAQIASLIRGQSFTGTEKN